MVYLDYRLMRSYFNSGLCILNPHYSQLLMRISGGDLLQTIDASKHWDNVGHLTPHFKTSEWVRVMIHNSQIPISFNVYQYTPVNEPLNRIYLDLDLALVYGSSLGGWPNIPISHYLNQYLRGKNTDERIVNARRILNRFQISGRPRAEYDLPQIGAQPLEGFDTRASSLPERYSDHYLGRVFGGTTGQIFAAGLGALATSIGGRTPAKWQSKAALIRTAYMNALRLILGFPLRPVFFVLNRTNPQRARDKESIHLQIGLSLKNVETITDAEMRMVYKLAYEHPSQIMRRATILSFIPIETTRYDGNPYGAMEACPHNRLYGATDDDLKAWTERIRTNDRLDYMHRKTGTQPPWVTATENGINLALISAQTCNWPAGAAALRIAASIAATSHMPTFLPTVSEVPHIVHERACDAQADLQTNEIYIGALGHL